MDYKLWSIGLLLSISLTSVAFDDASCHNADSACIEELWNILKIKRISDIDLGDWQGQKRITARNDESSGRRKLCIFASSNALVSSWRHVRDYMVQLNGRSPVLTMAGGSEIPITLRLIGLGKGTAGINQNLSQGSVMVKGNNAYTVCRDYEFSIEAQVLQKDILAHAQPGYYYGTFSLQVDEIDPARSLRSPDFHVGLLVHSVAQVLQLKDVNLKATNAINGHFISAMEFCVFTLGGEAYRLSLDTQNNPSRDFYLWSAGGGNFLSYKAVFSGFGGQGQVFNRADSTSDYYFGDRGINCSGRTNASISIEVPVKQASQVPAGIYQDVMKVTVEPL